MLNPSRLKNVHSRGDKIIAQCPACAEAGHDQTGDHLVIFPDGKFGCVANPGDAQHRKRIWRLAGTPGKRMPPPPCGGYIQFKKETKPKVIRVVHIKPTDASDACFSLVSQKITGMDNHGAEDSAISVVGGAVGGKEPSETSVAATGKTTSAIFSDACGREPSEVSAEPGADRVLVDPRSEAVQDQVAPPEDMVEQAADMFGGEALVIPPGGGIPDEFFDVVASWDVVQNHPAWKDNPQIKKLQAGARLRLYRAGATDPGQAPETLASAHAK